MLTRTEPKICPRVKRAVRWLMTNPGTAFYGSVALKLKWVMTDVANGRTVKTAATDGVHVFINQQWADSLSRPKLRTACLHEIEHVTNKHHLRIGKRPMKRANIAADYAINGNQRQAGFEHWDGAYVDKKYYNLSFETIDRLLEDEEREAERKRQEEEEKRRQEEQQKQSQDENDESDPDEGDDEDDSDDDGDDQNDENGDGDEDEDDTDGEDSDDDDEGEGDDGDSDEDEDGDADDSEDNGGDDGEEDDDNEDSDGDEDSGEDEDDGDEDSDDDDDDGDELGKEGKPLETFDGDMGQVIPFEGTPTELIDHERQLNITIEHAIGVARAANGGSTPGHLTQLVEERAKAYVRWEDELREFIDSPARVDWTWLRRSRYQLPNVKYVLQGTEPDGINRVVFVIDMSGSIDSPMFARFVAEAQAALDQGIISNATFVYHDATIHYVDEFVSGEIITPRPPTRGGTKFSPVLDWLVENASDAAGVVWFTDLLNESTDWLVCNDPGLPLLWCVYGKPWVYRPTIMESVKFGRALELLH